MSFQAISGIFPFSIRRIFIDIFICQIDTSGKCNLIVTDIPTAKAAAFANPELTVLQFPEDKGFKTSKEDVEIGIAIKKGNKELKDAMDAVLGKMTPADFDKMMDEAIQKQPLAK